MPVVALCLALISERFFPFCFYSDLFLSGGGEVQWYGKAQSCFVAVAGMGLAMYEASYIIINLAGVRIT